MTSVVVGPDSRAHQTHEKRLIPWDVDKPAVKAHAVLLVWSLAPLIVTLPTNINIVVTAALTVYCGSFRSVKPTPPTESMSKGDAMRFPVMGSCVLFSLFLAFKFLPKDMVNALLALYFAAIAVLAATAAVVPYVYDYFPENLRTWHLPLPAFKIPFLLDNSEAWFKPSAPELASAAVAVAFCSWYWVKKHWFANNVLGLVFSLEGIEHLSLGSTQVGCILLTGLFFYDIFWVFCTPVMVSVAKNFDAPIKLLFPRALDAAAEAGAKRPFSMLGLGDIVIPGIFLALLLRHDVSRSFRSKYFQSAFGGYVAGLVTTIGVMNYFQAAQPALLYIVPAVLGAVALHAASKGELLLLFNWSEAQETAPGSEGAAEIQSSNGSAADSQRGSAVAVGPAESKKAK